MLRSREFAIEAIPFWSNILTLYSSPQLNIISFFLITLNKYLLVSNVSGEHPAAMHHGVSTILLGPSLLVLITSNLMTTIYQSIRWKIIEMDI